MKSTYTIKGKEYSEFDINKKRAELMDITRGFVCDFTYWDDLEEKHNCSKLIAACICFIEVNYD